MQTLWLTLLALAVIMLIMSVGVLMGRKPIAGSCGGMSALGMETECDVCGGDKQVCETEQQKRLKGEPSAFDSDLAHDATRS
ncbi:ApbE family protein [Terasakiispira papahanaumokuakeensis]|uniref:ApbE family protein n=1 Tax=Terasakiispira papahanaumokuakeensis TaxID=197479 RepID=A0A1E2V7J8_9GAMM|nr:(Na+)-NQR maturation NqrM [Terasakiispira papahanaumokuakeensis]ODC02961.1 ApbE family protein [Terasakiispira papahanaumokuakeensis]